MLALFLAAFIGPGLGLARSRQQRARALPCAAVLARGIRARQNVGADDPDVADDLGSGPAAFRSAGIPRRRRLGRGQCADRLGNVCRRVDLDYGSLLARPRTLGVGEVEAGGRRAHVRRVLCRRSVRRRDQRGAANQLGLALQHRLSGRLHMGAGSWKALSAPPTARSSSAVHWARNCPSDGAGSRCSMLAGMCLYMLARKIRGAEVVR